MYTRAVLATWPASVTGTAARTTSKRPVRRIEHSLHTGGGTDGDRIANPGPQVVLGEAVGDEAEILATILGIERGDLHQHQLEVLEQLLGRGVGEPLRIQQQTRGRQQVACLAREVLGGVARVELGQEA